MCWKVGKTGLSVGAINSYQAGPGFTERNSIGELNWTDLKLKALMKKQCQKRTGLMKTIHMNVILIYTCLPNVLVYMKIGSIQLNFT